MCCALVSSAYNGVSDVSVVTSLGECACASVSNFSGTTMVRNLNSGKGAMINFNKNNNKVVTIE